MSSLIPKKIGNMTYKIEKDETMGMKVPVIIYANDQLLEKMMTGFFT
jgi:tRNA-splicing ligase RtcB